MSVSSDPENYGLTVAKCFTPLEITHFKDVFRSLADEQDGIHYWKEETLCRFLVIPDALGPGPLVYQMVHLLAISNLWLANMRYVGYLSGGFPVSQPGTKYTDDRGHAQGCCYHDRKIRESLEERESKS